MVVINVIANNNETTHTSPNGEGAHMEGPMGPTEIFLTNFYIKIFKVILFKLCNLKFLPLGIRLLDNCYLWMLIIRLYINKNRYHLRKV